MSTTRQKVGRVDRLVDCMKEEEDATLISHPVFFCGHNKKQRTEACEKSACNLCTGVYEVYTEPMNRLCCSCHGPLPCGDEGVGSVLTALVIYANNAFC